MQQRVINEWKRDRVTCGSQFSREGFSAWLGKKVKAKMEGHLLPSLKLSRNIFLQDFQQSSKRLVSKVLFFGFVFFFPLRDYNILWKMNPGNNKICGWMFSIKYFIHRYIESDT